MFLSSARSVSSIGQIDLRECALIIAVKRFIKIQTEKTSKMINKVKNVLTKMKMLGVQKVTILRII